MRTIVALVALMLAACCGTPDTLDASDGALDAVQDAPACVRDRDCPSPAPGVKERCWEGACYRACLTDSINPLDSCPDGGACVPLGDTFGTQVCQ